VPLRHGISHISRSVYWVGGMTSLAQFFLERAGRLCAPKLSERIEGQRRLRKGRPGICACAPLDVCELPQQSGPSFVGLQQLFRRADFWTHKSFVFDKLPHPFACEWVIKVGKIPCEKDFDTISFLIFLKKICAFHHREPLIGPVVGLLRS